MLELVHHFDTASRLPAADEFRAYLTLDTDRHRHDPRAGNGGAVGCGQSADAGAAATACSECVRRATPNRPILHESDPKGPDLVENGRKRQGRWASDEGRTVPEGLARAKLGVNRNQRRKKKKKVEPTTTTT